VFQPATGAGTKNNIIGLGHVRYFAPVVALGLIAFGAELRSRLPQRWSWLAGGVLLVVLLWNVLGSPLLIRGDETRGPIVAAALMAVAGICWWVGQRPGVGLKLGVAGVLLVTLVVGGRALATDYENNRNLAYSHYLVTRKPVRIGMLGMTVGFIHYKLFGPNLQNRVEFIGVRGGQGRIRPVSSCEEMVTLVNRGNYDLVYASRNRYSYENKFVSSPEQAWLDAQPSKWILKRVHLPFTQGYMNIYKFNKPLSVAYCPKQ
jgi:hypothetical protein